MVFQIRMNVQIHHHHATPRPLVATTQVPTPALATMVTQVTAKLVQVSTHKSPYGDLYIFVQHTGKVLVTLTYGLF